MSRRKVEAWAVVGPDGKPRRVALQGDVGTIYVLNGERVVPLTESTSDAVARAERAVIAAARKAVASKARVSWGVRELNALGVAVAKLLKARKAAGR